MFVRSKVVKGHTYYQLVEGYRDELGRVRHRNVVGLGQSATVEEALRVEKRRLASSRRERSRYPAATSIAGKTTRARVERLDRRISEAEARVELLKSILAGDVPSVDTTAVKTERVDTTGQASEWEYVRTDEKVAEICGVPVETVRKIRRLRERSPELLQEVLDDRVSLDDASDSLD